MTDLDFGKVKEWEVFKKIQVIEVDGQTKVLVKGQPYMSWKSTDQVGQRVAIVQLYNSNLGTKEELSEAFGISLKTIYNYITTVAREGMQGLIGQRSGPKQSWKLVPAVRAKILLTVLKDGIREYSLIQKRIQENWNMQVSTENIRQVLIESGFVNGENSLPDVEIIQADFFDRQEEDQIQLHFDWNIEQERIISEEGYKKIENREANNHYIGIATRYRRHYSQTQRAYLDRLEQGEYNAYAGGLLFAPLLKRYSFLPTLTNVINISTYEGYSLEELCLTLFYFDLFGFRSMEDFKTVYPEEFGMLISRSYSPSLYTLRRFLHKVRKLDKSEKLIDEFASTYLKLGIARWGVLYIDGHFLPYYGMYPISKGWHGVRRIPMKGSYNFIGVDEKFNPWIFLIRSSSEDLLQKIPELIEKAKKIRHDIGLSHEEIENLIVIFDREGYSAELYRFLDGRDRGDRKRRAMFISWAKYTDKWINNVAEEKFDKSVRVTYEIQGSEEIKYFQTERMMNKYGVIRTIAILSVKNKRRAAIYTNSNENEVSAEKIIELICRRWGEENLIKELLLKHLINYSPGYVAEQMEDQPMVDNPKVKELKKERAGRVSELHKLKVQLADKILSESHDRTNLDEIKKNQIQLLADIVGINNEILFINQKLDKLPAKIRFDQAHDGERLLNLNYEKKRFIDCIKVFTYNMEKKMCEILLDYYDVRKEILPALSMIVERGGYIKLEGGKLKVQLRRFMNREIDYAARHLCEDLSKMEPVTLDKFRLPLHYEVL